MPERSAQDQQWAGNIGQPGRPFGDRLLRGLFDHLHSLIVFPDAIFAAGGVFVRGG
jgi:hypothetical protein